MEHASCLLRRADAAELAAKKEYEFERGEEEWDKRRGFCSA